MTSSVPTTRRASSSFRYSRRHAKAHRLPFSWCFVKAMISHTAMLCRPATRRLGNSRKDTSMIRKLFCRWGIGHHWLAQMSDGEFPRHCVYCGKEDSHNARWSGKLSAGDRPEDPHARDYY
jgi:hypothetical protein